MSLDPNSPSWTSPRDLVATARRRRRAQWVVLALLVTVPVVLWVSGVRPSLAWSQAGGSLATVTVDRGDLAIVVVESGSLESSNNTTLKCKVEALAGLVSGSSGTSGRSGGLGSAGGGAGGSAGVTAAAPAATKAKGQAALAKGGTSQASAGGASAGGATTGAGQRPVIRSFTMKVATHVPLRPRTSTTTQTKAAPASLDPSGGSGGGGGGGGGRRGGGSSSSSETMERPGSTRILSILPEGTRVQAGDVVCELDSATFRDQLAAQLIRYEQAKAWVEQARTILEVSEISLSEYRDGIYPQDQALIRQYVATCQTELQRAQGSLDWSREAQQKQVRTASQVHADELIFEQAEIALREAQGMQKRLELFTASRLIKSLEAKIEAVRADLLTQQGAFQLEDGRLRRLKATVANCTMQAPRDGIVVYFSQSNGRGRVEDLIREGVTVREGQPIINLPDPNRMSIKVRVNESKVSLIRPGQRAVIRIDAFPKRPLDGTVAELTPIPAPASGPISDIKVYFATVTIDTGGFDDLRPGLSAEVSFLVDILPGVIRVPIQAIRWEGGRTFAAQETPAGLRWRPVTLGQTGAGYAEVRSGLEPGDRVVADPSSLPLPSLSPSGDQPT